MTTDLQERINGHLKGRAVPALPSHTFKDSGITVRLRKLSPMTGQEVAAAVRKELRDKGKEPEPPIVEVDYGQGKIKRPHKGDPTYQEMLKEFEAEIVRIANDRMFKLAALDAVELTIGDVEREAITRKKRYLSRIGLDWQDDPDLDADENARLFFMTHIACGSPEDLQEFFEAIATRSGPTEAAIERHKESFPSDLQGSVDLGV